MVTATCMPTARKAVNRSHYIALETQGIWKNLEPLLLKTVWNLLNGISLEWIEKLMLRARSSHAPGNFSTRNNRSLSTVHLSLHLQRFLLFLSPDSLTQRLPIMPNFLLVTNISHVKIALNQISFFWPIPQGWENTNWEQTFGFRSWS